MKTTITYLGVDLSKERLDLAALEAKKEWSLPNGAAGWAKLIQEFGALQEAGLAVARVNPRQVRDYARASGLLAKTDRLDARVIARYGAHFAPEPGDA